MIRTLTALMLTFGSSTALAAGGGGLHLEGTYLPRVGGGTHDAPGLAGCFGASGYRVSDRGFRVGGEATYCRGRDTVNQFYGGAQLGLWGRGRSVYFTGYLGLGLGTLYDGSTPDVDPYRAIFAYLQPTVAVGIPLGPTALEVGLYSMMQLNVVRFVGTGDPRGLVTPAIGLRASFLFGDFRGRHATRCEDGAHGSCKGSHPEPRVSEPPLAIPGGDLPPPPPPDNSGDLPLAIPADAPPPPTGE